MKIEVTAYNVDQKNIPLRTRKYQDRTHFPVLCVPNSDTPILEFSNFYAITIVSAPGTLSPRGTENFGQHRASGPVCGVIRQCLSFRSKHGDLTEAR